MLKNNIFTWDVVSDTEINKIAVSMGVNDPQQQNVQYTL